MDLFERFNSKFGKWYEGLFGGEAGELRPKDVLRKIIAAMEDHRKEGFDSKIYVPNKYVLELAVDDAEERDYLLSFLDEEELVSVLQRFMAQNHYHTRGPLDFTIAEVPAPEREAQREKLRVKVRFEKGELPSPASVAAPPPAEAAALVQPPAPQEDLPTVSGFDDEPGTVPAVAWAALAVITPDGRKRHFSVTKPALTIGRSRNMGNDLILDNDGMVSKVHARLEREADGRFTLQDLNSTNGVRVGGVRISGPRVLHDGDEVRIGETQLLFHQTGGDDGPDDGSAAAGPPEPVRALRRARLVDPAGRTHVLASETLIGRAVTSDIVLEDPTVSTKHARIIAPDAMTYYLEDLGSDRGTWVNGRIVSAGQRVLLSDGDTLRLGGATLRFVGKSG